jgi:hypothetical protein
MGMGQWPTDETIVLVVPGACDGIARSAFGIGVELHAELTGTFGTPSNSHSRRTTRLPKEQGPDELCASQQNYTADVR